MTGWPDVDDDIDRMIAVQEELKPLGLWFAIVLARVAVRVDGRRDEGPPTSMDVVIYEGGGDLPTGDWLRTERQRHFRDPWTVESIRERTAWFREVITYERGRRGMEP